MRCSHLLPLLLLLRGGYVVGNIVGSLGISNMGVVRSGCPRDRWDGRAWNAPGCTMEDVLCSYDLKKYYTQCPECEQCWQEDCGVVKVCPPGTRCGCPPDKECPVAMRSNPCVSNEPYPFQKRATFTFNGLDKWVWNGLAFPIAETEENYRDVHPPTIARVTGMVKQDVEEGKFLQITTKDYVKWMQQTYLRTFTLIVPNHDDDTFVKYEGQFNNGKCKRSVIKKFQSFGKDLKKLLPTESKKGKDGKTKHTMEFKVSVIMMSEMNWKWKWTIESDDATQTSRPVTTYYWDDKSNADSDNHHDRIQDVKWSTQDLDVKWSDDVKWYSDMWKEEGDWFRVPPMCQ